MKKINSYILCIVTTFLLFSCDTNKKLNQENAEKAIKEFVSKNSFSIPGVWMGQESLIDVKSITTIEPINQFSENEASSIVHYSYVFVNMSHVNGTEEFSLKFNFKKNIDKHWVLTSVESASEHVQWKVKDMLENWHNINVLAQ